MQGAVGAFQGGVPGGALLGGDAGALEEVHELLAAQERRDAEGPAGAEGAEDEALLVAQRSDLGVELDQTLREGVGQWPARCVEQVTDPLQRDARPAVPADRGQAGVVGGVVAAVAGPRARRRREEPDPVVVEQGAPGQAVPGGEPADRQLPGYTGGGPSSIVPVVR